MTIVQRIEEPAPDQFPVGMRVLAVDDDPTCLLLLERLLTRCKYHITTRTHAIAALNLLRENKGQFDLVISDVHMPDMDGFKLLELVGLEMDLPVIMLSANGDPNLVMKGITHGACDYLLKPVRIEELQIIWQHVIRRKKVDPKTSENGLNGSSERGQGGVGNRYNGDPKTNRKRKDQVEDEGDDHDENGLDSDDPSAQKKPRVVWSIELHRKFFEAVNHLGIDKAVPKRILELMNVEKLTRENVASHLQKYRLYLRRISCVQSQQANMAAAFGNTDPTSYLRISSLNGMGDFNTLSRSSHFQNAPSNSFLPNAMLGRLNSSTSVGFQRLPSPVQVNHSHFSGFTGHAFYQGMPTLIHGNQSGHFLKGMPVSFEFDQLQDSNSSHLSDVREVIPKESELAGVPVSSGLLEGKGLVRRLNGSHITTSNNTMMFQGHSVQGSSQLETQNQLSGALPSLSPDLSSHFLDCVRGNDHWPIAVQSSAVQTNLYAPYRSQHINTYVDNGSSMGEMPLSVADYQYQATHPSIDVGAPPFGQDTISIPRMKNSERIPEFSTVEHPAYIDRQVEQSVSMHNSKLSHGKSPVYQLPNTVGSLEDLVSSMMN